MTEELKPCPFCGGDAEFYESITGRMVLHSDAVSGCPVGGIPCYIDEWNQRALPRPTEQDAVRDAREALLSIELLATNHSGWLESKTPMSGLSKIHAHAQDALAALDNPEPSAEVKGGAFQRLVDLHDALVLTREHNPQTSVASLVDSSSEFRRARDYLHSHQYDGIDCAAASSAEVNALRADNEMLRAEIERIQTQHQRIRRKLTKERDAANIRFAALAEAAEPFILGPRFTELPPGQAVMIVACGFQYTRKVGQFHGLADALANMGQADDR